MCVCFHVTLTWEPFWLGLAVPAYYACTAQQHSILNACFYFISPSWRKKGLTVGSVTFNGHRMARARMAPAHRNPSSRLRPVCRDLSHESRCWHLINELTNLSPCVHGLGVILLRLGVVAHKAHGVRCFWSGPGTDRVHRDRAVSGPFFWCVYLIPGPLFP